MLQPSQRRAVLALFFLICIGMVLETLGIGIFIPALALLTQSDFSTKYSWVVPFSVTNFSRIELVIFGMLALVGINLVKALFLAFLAWVQARFVYQLQADLSERLFVGYLRQPYTFHLQRNSAELLTSINQIGEVGSIVQQSLILLAETLVLIGVSVLLLAVEPVATLLVLGGLGSATLVFHRATRGRIFRWGEARQHHEGHRIRHIQQGLGSAKDVKLLGRESEFIRQYRTHNLGTAWYSRRQAFLGTLPRLWLELLAVTGMASVVIAMVLQGKPTEALIPIIGLFGASAFRLLPSITRIVNTAQNVRYFLPVINSVHAQLKLLADLPRPQQGKPISFERTIELDNITFRYSSTERRAVKGVSLEIPKGATVGFIGSSGSGKSTLVDILLGLLSPESGAVKVDGVDIQKNLRSWQDKIGYVPQSIYLTDDTLRRNIAFGLPNEGIDEEAVQRAVRASQLDQFINELPEGLDTVVGERGVRLSGGQRQRIGIARALYHDPAVLVLDEATSALDVATESGVMAAIRNLRHEKTIIIVAHRLSTVEYCDRLYRFSDGRIVKEGSANEVLSDPSLQSGPKAAPTRIIGATN